MGGGIESRLNMSLLSLVVFADTIYERAGLPAGDPSRVGENIKNLVFIAAGVVMLYILISAGFKYVTSGGNAENTKKAGQTILFAVIGMFILLISYTIMTWVFRVGGK